MNGIQFKFMIWITGNVFACQGNLDNKMTGFNLTMQSLNELDRQLLKWAYQRPYKNSLPVKMLIFTGDAMFWMTVLCLIATAGQLFDSEPLKQLGIQLMLASLIGVVIFLLGKIYVKRRRPYANEQLQHDLNIKIENRDAFYASKEMESFPSGHALWTTVSVSLICFQFGPLFVLLIGWMIPAMIYLRPHLGVHYPSDVIVSLFLGIIIVSLILFISPGIFEYTNSIKGTAAYTYGYWAALIFFMIIGIKIWLKRI
jgi:membrane-associated phospholipid phosphatase